MRRDLDTRKAVKRELPKHKYHFESLFEYKSDDEDDNDTHADNLKDDLDQPVPARLTGFEFITAQRLHEDRRKNTFYACPKSLQNQYKLL